MISVLLLCWQLSGDRLELYLIGLFKVPIIRDLAEETVDGSDLMISVLLVCWETGYGYI